MYRAQTTDIRATFELMVDADRLARTERFADATLETLAALVDEAGHFAEQRLAPLNHGGDVAGARLENGVMRTSPGFADAYRRLAEGGWVGMSADPAHGGMGLPITALSAVNELMASSCLSLSLCPLLSQGAIEALERHGTPEQQALYLPKLVSGRWTGTMNLTEPQAGSDVGALATRAEPAGDGGYRITGTKIWISWGDADFAENVVHLVLARLPDAPAGSRGVSLFLVPKFLPDADGEPGARNALRVVSIEHKMGLHGSPTCVMAYEGATGWLVGEEHKGLACMFTMMNAARLGVGIEGVGVAEAATQAALAFALQRRQGATPVGDGRGPIFDHADVRRMLTRMRALTQAARAIAYDCAMQLDLAKAADTAAERAAAAALGAALTPIAKAFGTDVGHEVAHLGIQVHGGMGYIEETGVAQFARDIRVTAIYEGTNGIQAMDLIGRKLTMDDGATLRRLLDLQAAEAEALAAAGAQGSEPLAAVAGRLAEAVAALRGATDWMRNAAPNDRAAGAVAYLRAMALTIGAAHLGRAARRSGDPARTALAHAFATQFAPEAAGLARAAVEGADGLYALSAADLGA